jgi:formate C-acetyltransferase
LIDDCIKNGKDYNDGGARYNTSYVQGVGIGSITDSLTAIKYNVYDKKRIKMAKLLDALKHNFEGYESVQEILLNDTPKYGNDDDYPDNIMRQVFEIYFKAVDGRPNTKGGYFRINLLQIGVRPAFGRDFSSAGSGQQRTDRSD